MKFPANCTTDADKLAFCYKAQELLQEEHNSKGLDKREGRISEAQWLNYKKGRFTALQRVIANAIVAQRKKLKESDTWSVDLGDIQD